MSSVEPEAVGRSRSGHDVPETSQLLDLLFREFAVGSGFHCAAERSIQCLGERVHHRRAGPPEPQSLAVSTGDQLPVPAQDRVRRDQSRILLQQPTSEELPLGRETAALVIGESYASTTELLVELLAQDTVLLDQLRDDILLPTIHPPGEGQEEELQCWGGGHPRAGWTRMLGSRNS